MMSDTLRLAMIMPFILYQSLIWADIKCEKLGQIKERYTLQKDLGINFLLDYQEIVNKLKGRTIEQLLKFEQTLLKTNEALTILAERRKEDLER